MLQIQQTYSESLGEVPSRRFKEEGWQTWQKVNINFETFSSTHAAVQIDVDGHAPTGHVHREKVLLKLVLEQVNFISI